MKKLFAILFCTMLCISAFAQRLTVATVENGTITATPTTPAVGDVVTLTATPNADCVFVEWYVYQTGNPSKVVTVVNDKFTMPNYKVTVSAVFATTTGDELTIGSGNNTSAYIPSCVYYNYSLTQQIYTAAELGEAGTITAIAFRATSNTATRNLDIYIKPTSKTSFTSTTDWETMSDMYKVHTGTVTFSSTDWTTITLRTPFEYDGEKNLNICIVDNTGANSHNAYPSFMVYSTNANRALRACRDNNNYSIVGYTQTVQNYYGNYVNSNNQIKLTKVLKNTQSIIAAPNAIDNFDYVYEDGPSISSIIDILGVDIDSDITVTAPAEFEITAIQGGTFVQSVTIPRTGGKGDRAETNWNFEGNFLDWTTIDADNDGHNWLVSTSLMSNFNNGHNSSNALSSQSYVAPATSGGTGTPLTPDNWLVSPQLTLGGTFTIWACAQDAAWAAEHFGIFVSTTSNTDVNTFTMLNEWTLGAKGGGAKGEHGSRGSGDWYQFTVDLSAYDGETGYIAVRHFGCTDMFYLNVDDFTLNTESTYVPNLSVVVTPTKVYARMQEDLEPGVYSGNITITSGDKSAVVSVRGEVYANDEEYTITTNVNPVDGGEVTGAGTYHEGCVRTLTATPNTYYTFTRWMKDGVAVSADNPYSITVTDDAIYTAVFSAMETYSVTLNQATGGTINANLSTAHAGDVVTLTKTPDIENGYFFGGWSVRDANNNNIAVEDDRFIMPENNVTVTAAFKQSFSVRLLQTDHGTVTLNDAVTSARPGDHVYLTATPDPDCMLLTWYVYRTGNPRDVVATINDNYFIMPALDVTIMAVFVTTQQDEFSVGSGNGTDDDLPVYVRANYSMTQQIYTASELSNKKGIITKISFLATKAESTRDVVIYMRKTNKTSFATSSTSWTASYSKDWEVMDASVKVFEGSVTFAKSGWTTITLDTPFNYNGTSNINICVIDNTGSTSGTNGNHTNFYHYSASDRSLYVSGSNSYATAVGITSSLGNVQGTKVSYVNQIKFTMTLIGSAESITLAPTMIEDFSYVEGFGPSNSDKVAVVGVDLHDDISITAPKDFEISLSENGYYGESVVIPHAVNGKGRGLTTWEFEGSMDGWTTNDADGDDYNWVLGSQCGGVYLAEGESITDGYNGSRDMIVSGSWTNAASTALTPDNWLISPQVTLNGAFSVWAQPYKASYIAEHFGIFVSTTGTDPEDFTMLNEWTLTSADWKNYSVNLDQYYGRAGYIAVRHFGMENDEFILKLDNFELNTSGAITLDLPVTITTSTAYVRMKGDLNYGSYQGQLVATSGAKSAENDVTLRGLVIATYDVKLGAPNPIESGRVGGGGSYDAGTIITVRAVPNTGYAFVNWTENDVEVSTDAEYTFTVTSNRNLVANFERAVVARTITLARGWNWISPTVVTTLAGFETELGSSGIIINTQKSGFVQYTNDTWAGTLAEFDPGQMYQIQTSAACEINLSGYIPLNVNVTIVKGYNWFGYVGESDTPIQQVLEGFTPAEGDMINSYNEGFTQYVGGVWTGTLTQLKPGRGYIYMSNDTNAKQLNVSGN